MINDHVFDHKEEIRGEKDPPCWDSWTMRTIMRPGGRITGQMYDLFCGTSCSLFRCQSRTGYHGKQKLLFGFIACFKKIIII